MLHFTINFMAILCSASDLAIGGHLDFLFLYPIAVRPMDRRPYKLCLWRDDRWLGSSLADSGQVLTMSTRSVNDQAE